VVVCYFCRHKLNLKSSNKAKSQQLITNSFLNEKSAI
jgi:hypothetical protein